MEGFKSQVLEYYKLEQKLKEHREEMKRQKTEQNTLTENIIQFMNINKIENCKVQDEVLHLKKQSQLESINKEYMSDILIKFFKDGIKSKHPEELAVSATDFILNNRDNQEKFKLVFKKK